MTCGSVDDGKSSLLGRLLFETKNIPIDQSEYLANRLKDKQMNNDLDYSLLLDGLIDEKEQGITIDIAFKFFTLNDVQFTLIDSPGHIEFTKNMANAATFADLALILVDASKGLTEQTKKHLEIVGMFPNITKKIICLNKIDKINYSENKYEEIKKEINNHLKQINFATNFIIPISALNGDNLIKNSEKTKFYEGKPLLNLLTETDIIVNEIKNPSSTVKFVKKEKDNRVYFLENNQNNFKIGDELINVFTNEKSKVKKIYHNLENKHFLNNELNSAIELEKEISVNSGDSFVKNNIDFTVSNSFKGRVFWFDNSNALKGKRYEFKFKTKSSKGFLSKIDNYPLSKNGISDVKVELENLIHLDEYLKNYYLSQFIIIDLDNSNTVGFGYVIHNLDKGSFVVNQKLQHTIISDVTKCLWLTGLPASGKSSIAKDLGKKLNKLGISFYILDGDNVRNTISKDLGFSDEDRIENNRRVAHISRMFFEAGVMPIVATVSPNASSRQFARNL